MKTMILAGLLLAGCGGGVGAAGALVGAACDVDSQCVHRCVRGDSHYPGGLCSLTCRSDADCPGGSSCVDDANGICAVNCLANDNCAGFGRGFSCDDVDRVGGGPKATVCRVK